MKKLFVILLLAGIISACSMTLGPEDTAISARQPPPTPIVLTQKKVVPVQTEVVSKSALAFAGFGLLVMALVTAGALYLALSRPTAPSQITVVHQLPAPQGSYRQLDWEGYEREKEALQVRWNMLNQRRRELVGEGEGRRVLEG